MGLPNPLYGIVLEEALRTSKRDTFYYQLFVKTTDHGRIKCMMWDAHAKAAEDSNFPHTGDLIAIHSFKDQLDQHHNIVINPLGFKRVQQEDVPENEKKLFEVPKATKKEMDWAAGVILDEKIWENEDHYTFVKQCMGHFDRKTLAQCPAASQIHHNYQGGFMVHTAEVLQLCKAMYECSEARKYTFVSPDVLYAGAILHDIGKVITYGINDLGLAEKLPIEKSLGHIYLGMRLVHNIGESIVDPDYLVEVLHCIATHHGKVEYGSIRTIQSQEAQILSVADSISSRNGKLDSWLKENGPELRDEFDIYRDPYFASMGMKEFLKEK
jgi:3'-5' exoribonuclease